MSLKGLVYIFTITPVRYSVAVVINSFSTFSFTFRTMWMSTTKEWRADYNNMPYGQYWGSYFELYQLGLLHTGTS